MATTQKSLTIASPPANGVIASPPTGVSLPHSLSAICPDGKMRTVLFSDNWLEAIVYPPLACSCGVATSIFLLVDGEMFCSGCAAVVSEGRVILL